MLMRFRHNCVLAAFAGPQVYGVEDGESPDGPVFEIPDTASETDGLLDLAESQASS